MKDHIRGRGSPFEKGKSANPGGLPRLWAQAKELARHARETIIQKYHEVHLLTEEQLYAKMKDSTTPGAEKAIVSIMIHAIKYGDQNRFGALVERVCGKVKEEVEISVLRPCITVINRPNGETVELGYEEVKDDNK